MPVDKTGGVATSARAASTQLYANGTYFVYYWSLIFFESFSHHVCQFLGSFCIHIRKLQATRFQ